MHVGVHVLGFTFVFLIFRDILCDYTEELQPVPKKTSLEMPVEMQIKSSMVKVQVSSQMNRLNRDL